MKRIAMAGAVLALAVPAAATAEEQAPTARESAAKACKQLRTDMKELFAQTYGTNKNRRNAFGKCVSKLTREAKQARSNAAQECRAEREDPNFAAAHGGKTFEQHYGTNKTGSNAFGKCVSSKASEQVEEEVEATENAAKTCKAERTKIGRDAFNEKYGTNRNKRNAFGKCVSSTAKAQQESQESQES